MLLFLLLGLFSRVDGLSLDLVLDVVVEAWSGLLSLVVVAEEAFEGLVNGILTEVLLLSCILV